MDSEELKRLGALMALMREQGCFELETGAIHIKLAPTAPSPIHTNDEPTMDGTTQQRRLYFENMLGRPVGDAELAQLPGAPIPSRS